MNRGPVAAAADAAVGTGTAAALVVAEVGSAMSYRGGGQSLAAQ